LATDPDNILGRLTSGAERAGFHQHIHTQTAAWRDEIDLLKTALAGIDAHILLEYPIPRRAKRVDSVLLVGGIALVVEFKFGAASYGRDAIAQVEDYCLDLRDFHWESRGRTIVPMLIATEAPNVDVPVDDFAESVKAVWKKNKQQFRETVRQCISRYALAHTKHLDPDDWNHSDYIPTPTMIEAAQTLYAGNNVREIARCEAGHDNLTQTTEAVLAAITRARETGRKSICFITGVPGSGKTLAGLNIVHNHGLHEGDLGVFLSGNGPLVRVLTEALARDHRDRTKEPLKSAQRRVSTFIQNVHRFIDEYFAEPSKIPEDRVVVFDEAQRAWNAEQSKRKFKRDFSEPELMLEIMGRHQGWCVIIALIGLGQEINRGEAGLSEWGRALGACASQWDVVVSGELKRQAEGREDGLFKDARPDISITEEPALHLQVSLRSFKSEKVSDFVDAILSFKVVEARALMAQLNEFPIVLTRSLESARAWLNHRQRGNRRIGLIASSGARRLKAHGLDVTTDLDVENWFLNPRDDVRSSFYLETPATEFGIQGLELDWTGICWGGDLTPMKDAWRFQSFRGTSWQAVHDPITQQYTVNKYRVLLTRAREGMVIWVPPGSAVDPTRPPDLYDRVYQYLIDCGVPSIADFGTPGAPELS